MADQGYPRLWQPGHGARRSNGHTVRRILRYASYREVLQDHVDRRAYDRGRQDGPLVSHRKLDRRGATTHRELRPYLDPKRQSPHNFLKRNHDQASGPDELARQTRMRGAAVALSPEFGVPVGSINRICTSPRGMGRCSTPLGTTNSSPGLRVTVR